MSDTSIGALGAIYTALAAEAALTAIVGDRIFQMSAPQGKAFPYVVIGPRSTDQRFKTKDAVIQSHSLKIYAYSRTTRLEVDTIKAKIFNALEKQTLTPSEGVFVDLLQEGIDDSILMPDGRTYRSIVEFIITIQ